MIYKENPFVEVFTICVGVYALLEKNADDEGYIWMYLIVGSEKSMLIDTGSGVGDLKKLCTRLSGSSELIVVNTHSHPDHAYGNCRFDSIYCHPRTFHELHIHNEHMWDKLFDNDGNGIWMNFTKDDLPTFKKYSMLACSDGTIFNLGDDLQIEVIETPGHHCGHICFLDRRHRLLFAGDSICSDEIHVEGPWNRDPFSEYSTIFAYLYGINRLYFKKKEFDFIFPSHGNIKLKSDVINSLLQTCCGIIATPEIFDRSEPASNGQTRFFKKVEQLGTIVYRSVML